MKIWLAALSVVLVAVMLFVGITIPNIDRDNTRLQQKAIAAEVNLNAVKNELQETVSKNTALEEKLKTVEANLEAEKIKLGNKITELEQAKADRRELGLVEFALMENIDDLRDDLKKDISMVDDKIFEPAKIYEKIIKTVVRIEFGDNSGTGFLFESKNQIITNFHVAGPPGTKVKVFPNDGVYTAILGEVKKINMAWDLAAIELAVPLNAEPLTPADVVRNLNVGQNVLLIGSPSKLINSISPGNINGLDRKTSTLSSVGMIQIDSAAIPGFSGGPVLNAAGEVIGVLSLGMGDFKFAIPIDYVKRFLEKP